MVFSFPWTKKLPEASPGKTVLIIGGGIAGLSAVYALRQLDPDVTIILVDPKEYCEIFWASYRSPFEEWVAKESLVKLDRYCQKYDVQHVQGTVSHVSKSAATCTLLQDKTTKTIDFDVCVMATGASSHWAGMGRSLPTSAAQATAQHRLEAMAAEGKRLLAAKSIVIVGGGLIGTELAGDLAAYAKKEGKSLAITLIHSGPQLCPVMSPPAAAKMQEKLEGLGIEIILNEKGIEENGKVILQNSKKEIPAEIVIKTIGFQSVNSFMEKDFSQALDEKGWITTNEHFVVPGSDGRIFAFGDCSPTLPDAGNIYMRTAEVLGNNMKAALLGKEEDMKKFEIPFAAFCNTAGPDQGIFYSSAFWTQYILPWIKNKTMFFMSPKDMIGVKKEYTLAD